MSIRPAPNSPCARCNEMGPGPHWRDNVAKEPCRECKQVKKRVLDTHHSDNVFCSLECERGFWFAIAFGG